ncbi:hypothetical protein HGG82_02450 [Marinomonas sp. M1K-6]|uniref:Uncharacterized protein n=1 Tax=Marinomonas profundi TaxID=2726122 RepID=A0A847QZR9_9GAMM|nr:hypothetical protein [Marinomonas profundi]NLQ16482.1 hypothetical protein [Marinomonas profundi]UDV03928.1 hypothetical protein J8N69_03905 [Marinomonas profundi]
MYEEASNTNLLMLLHTAVYPFLAALIVSFIAGKWLRAWSYIGYLGGFMVGLKLIHSGLSFPPHQAIDYYSASVLIGIVSVLSLTNVKGSMARNSLAFLLFGVSFYLLLNPVLKHSGLIISLSWAAACALISLLYCGISHKETSLATRQTGQTSDLSAYLLPIGLMIVAGSAAPVVSIGGSLLIGQLLGAFAAALFGYIMIGFILKATPSRNSKIPALLLLGGLISQSHVLADLPLSVILMLVVSAFVTPIAIQLNRKTSHVLMSQLLISVVVCGLGLWLIWPEGSLY